MRKVGKYPLGPIGYFMGTWYMMVPDIAEFELIDVMKPSILMEFWGVPYVQENAEVLDVIQLGTHCVSLCFMLLELGFLSILTADAEVFHSAYSILPAASPCFTQVPSVSKQSPRIPIQTSMEHLN